MDWINNRRFPGLRTDNLSLPSHSSTKRKAGQRSQFLRLKPSWRGSRTSQHLPLFDCSTQLWFLLLSGGNVWWGDMGWGAGSGEPLLFLIDWRFYCCCLFLLKGLCDFTFPPSLPSTVSLCWWSISWFLQVACPSWGKACSWHTPASFWQSAGKQQKTHLNATKVWLFSPLQKVYITEF